MTVTSQPERNGNDAPHVCSRRGSERLNFSETDKESTNVPESAPQVNKSIILFVFG